MTLHQLRHSGASVDMARQNRTLDAVQKRGAWSQAKSVHRYERSRRIAADSRKLPPEVRTSCEEGEKHLRQIMLGSRHPVLLGHSKNWCCCAKRSPRGLQRLWLRAFRCDTSGRYFADLFAGGREVARAAQAQGFRAQAWDTIFDAQRLKLCQSAVQSHLKYDIKLGRVLAVCLTPPSGATLMRAQRVAPCLFSFSAKYKIPTALVQLGASLLWKATTCQALLQSQRYTDVQLDLCQLGHTMRRPTRVLVADVDPCDAEKLRRTGTSHRETRDAIPSQLPAEFCLAASLEKPWWTTEEPFKRHRWRSRGGPTWTTAASPPKTCIQKEYTSIVNENCEPADHDIELESTQSSWPRPPAHECATLNLARSPSPLAARPHRTHNDGVDGFHPGPEKCANCSLDCAWEANSAVVESTKQMAGLFDAFPSAGWELEDYRVPSGPWRRLTHSRRRQSSDAECWAAT